MKYPCVIAGTDCIHIKAKHVQRLQRPKGSQKLKTGGKKKSESAETKEETTKTKTREMECYMTQPLPQPGLRGGWTGQEMVTHQSPSSRRMKGSVLQDREVVGDEERSKKKQTEQSLRNPRYVAVF